LRSLERLLEIHIDLILPGHGPLVGRPEAKIKEYIDHRLMRERQILQALGDGLATIPVMVEKIYAEVSKTLHAMAAQSVESHLKKLAREGRVLETVVRDAPSRWLLVR
jgi:glyoxylase-like metal-dependent hydrolase (beta-lactamase superfamily II)